MAGNCRFCLAASELLPRQSRLLFFDVPLIAMSPNLACL